MLSIPRKKIHDRKHVCITYRYQYDHLHCSTNSGSFHCMCFHALLYGSRRKGSIVKEMEEQCSSDATFILNFVDNQMDSPGYFGKISRGI